MKKRFGEEQIIGFLKDVDAGVAVKDLCRRHGFSEASYYLWRSKFGGMNVSDAKRLKELEKYKSRPIVVACRTGTRSGSAVKILRSNGFAGAVNLGGGIGAWEQAGMPLQKK